MAKDGNQEEPELRHQKPINKYIDVILEKNIFNINKKDVYYNSLHSNTKMNIDLNDDNNEINKFKKSKYGVISSVYIFGEGFED